MLSKRLSLPATALGFSALYLIRLAVDLAYRTVFYRTHLLSYLTPRWIAFMLVPALALIGTLIASASPILYGQDAKKTKRNALLSLALLVCTDQIIQYWINTHLDSIKRTLVEGWLSLDLWVIGTKAELGFYAGNLGDARIYLVVCAIAVLVLFYRYCFYFSETYHYQTPWHLTASFVLGLSGGLCSLLDGLLKGTVYAHAYDYIRLEHFGIFDLKDVYLTLFFGSFFLFYLSNRKQPALSVWKMPVKEIKEYCRWERTNLRQLCAKAAGMFRRKKKIV